MRQIRHRSRPLAGRSAWIITTGIAGMDMQTRGVAEALGLRYEMKPSRPRAYGRCGAVGTGCAVPSASARRVRNSPRRGRTVAISLGRGSVPYMRALRPGPPETFTVVMLEPEPGSAPPT